MVVNEKVGSFATRRGTHGAGVGRRVEPASGQTATEWVAIARRRPWAKGRFHLLGLVSVRLAWRPVGPSSC